MQNSSGTITHLINRFAAGDKEGSNRLFELTWGELRRIAVKRLNGERKNHTLQPTALVNEVYLQLAQAEHISTNNRNHFFRLVGLIMRRIIVDHARTRNTGKRGGKRHHCSIDEVIDFLEAKCPDLVALNDALELLAQRSERQAKIIELRFFCGFSGNETADILGVTTRTVQNEFNVARAMLFKEIQN